MMRALTPQQMLELWADYADAHPVDRTLGLVSAAVSAEQAEALPDLPLGTRERWALGVRLGTFGSRWEGVAVCPECGERHEVVPPVALLLADGDPNAEPVSLRVGERELWVRAPTSRDQAAIAAATGTEQGVRALLERCVSVRDNNQAPIATADLPPEVVASVAQLMSTLDPAAETWLQLQCVTCGAVWDALFDAGEFLWNEVAACAQRLLRQIHLLARAYGWRESDILSLSPMRREAYLELVLGS